MRDGVAMGFQQQNKLKREQAVAFENWKAANRALLSASGLPDCVTQSRDDWAYFLQFRYHDHGNWNTPPLTCIDFDASSLSSDQAAVVASLETFWDTFVNQHPVLAKRFAGQKSL